MGSQDWAIRKKEQIKEQVFEDDPIVQLLHEVPPDQHYLDVGYSEQHNVFWYGHKLSGKMAIILNDGRILRDKRERIKIEGEGWKVVGENEINKIFHYASELGDIAPPISNSTVETYYKHRKVGLSERLVDPKGLYLEVRDSVFNYFMDFSNNPEAVDVLTCWIICTFCYPLYYWFPHILFTGPRGSGKSKCGDICTFIGFRGFDLGASGGLNPSNVYRTLEGNRGLIKIDEYEENNSETQKLVNQLLNASAHRDAYIIRNEPVGKSRVYVPTKFPIYGPKVVCNISGLNPTALSRFIVFELQKTTTEKGKRKPYRKEERDRLENIRQKLYLFTLENWQAIKKDYDNFTMPEGITNRDEDNWSPIFTMARFFDSCDPSLKVFESVQKFRNSHITEDYSTDDHSESVLRCIFDVIDNNEQPYSIRQLIDASPELMELTEPYKQPNTVVGRVLRYYHFKRKRGGKGVTYLLSKDMVKRVLDLYYPTSITLPISPSHPTQHTLLTSSDITNPTQVSATIEANVSSAGYVGGWRTNPTPTTESCSCCGQIKTLMWLFGEGYLYCEDCYLKLREGKTNG